MPNFVDLLKKERDGLSKRMRAMDSAIAALSGTI
jgi:hypothetical protein